MLIFLGLKALLVSPRLQGMGLLDFGSKIRATSQTNMNSTCSPPRFPPEVLTSLQGIFFLRHPGHHRHHHVSLFPRSHPQKHHHPSIQRTAVHDDGVDEDHNDNRHWQQQQQQKQQQQQQYHYQRLSGVQLVLRELAWRFLVFMLLHDLDVRPSASCPCCKQHLPESHHRLSLSSVVEEARKPKLLKDSVRMLGLVLL